MLVKAVPSTPYTFVVCLAFDVKPTNYSTCGIVRTDGTKVQIFGLQYSNGWNLTVARHSAFNTYNSTQLTTGDWSSPFVPFNMIWLQLYDDGTNVHFSMSMNGADFSDALYLYSEASNAYLTPTQIGIGMDMENSNLGNMVCLSWSGV
jgi:uncharacterized protein YjbI with pentapeptide repeats